MSEHRRLFSKFLQIIYQVLVGQWIYILVFISAGGVLSSLSAFITVFEFYHLTQDSVGISRFKVGDFVRESALKNLRSYLIPSLIWSLVLGILTCNLLFLSRGHWLGLAIFLINLFLWALVIAMGIAFAYLSAHYPKTSTKERIQNAWAYVLAYLAEWLLTTVLLLASLLACWQGIPALFYLLGLGWLIKGYQYLMKQLSSGHHFGRWREYWRREDI